MQNERKGKYIYHKHQLQKNWTPPYSARRKKTIGSTDETNYERTNPVPKIGI